LAMCFNGCDPEIGFSQNFYFKPFPDSCTQRERERESPDHAFDFAGEPRAQITPRTISTPHTTWSELSHSNALLRPSSSPTTHTSSVLSIAAPRRSHRSCRSQHRADQAKIDSNTTRSRLRRMISPLPQPRDLASRSNLVASLFSFFSQFDRI